VSNYSKTHEGLIQALNEQLREMEDRVLRTAELERQLAEAEGKVGKLAG
jgi:hypothetical protein